MRKVIFIALSLLSVVGYGQGIKISALPQAGSLTGSELTPVVQNGITKKTSVQSIANLGGGSGSQNLQSVTTVGNTTSNNVQLLDSGNLIIGAYGGVLLDNSTSLKEGTFDNGTGGSKGISLNCAVGYELNWQGGHLSSSYNNGTTFYPVIIDSTLQLSGLGGSGSVIVTADNSGLLGKASLNNLAWGLTGNAGTNPATNFIGTTDTMPLVTKTNAIERMRVTGSGNVGIGVASSAIDSNKLTVIGSFFDSVPTTYGFAKVHIGGKFEEGSEGIVATNGYSLLGLLYDTLLPNKTNWHYSLGNEFSKVEGDSLKSSGLAGEGEVRLKTPNNTWIFDEDAMYATNGMGTIGYSTNSVGGVYTNGLKLTDGTQGAGKVLTSDTDGLASWQTLALTDTATLNFGSISANGHETLTITVTGAALSDVVSLGIPNASMNDHASFVAWVSSANTVSVKCFNFDGSNFNPAAGLFTVKVFK